MQIPFTIEEFLGVFAIYNTAVWPAQLALVAAAVVVIGLALESVRAGRWISAILALLWIWMAVVYHWRFFAPVNPAAYLFGAIFLVEAGLLAWLGVVRGALGFRPRHDLTSALGGVLIAYALVAYPLLGGAAGHWYPIAPTFGVPCPTTIFTLGVLLRVDRHERLPVLVIPVAWALVGSSAAWQLGMVEDYGRAVAALVAVAATLPRPAAWRYA